MFSKLYHLSALGRRNVHPRFFLESKKNRLLPIRWFLHERSYSNTTKKYAVTSVTKNMPKQEAVEIVQPPTNSQLRAHFLASALRMIGFGAMDMTVMLQAGHAIDMSLGVTFGISTLTAAALGEVCSSSTAVLFGGTLESLAKKAGLPRSGLTAAQRALPIVNNTSLLGALVGVIVGCLLGMTNLLFMDTEKVQTLKLQAMQEGQELAFEVDASNAIRKDATVFTVRGPDVDGVLAAMTTALASVNCSLVELSAHRSSDEHRIEDTFVVVREGRKIPNDELNQVASLVLDATHVPIRDRASTEKVTELKEKNHTLHSHAAKLENFIKQSNIHVTRGSVQVEK